jgi:hypothetical protein
MGGLVWPWIGEGSGSSMVGWWVCLPASLTRSLLMEVDCLVKLLLNWVLLN